MPHRVSPTDRIRGHIDELFAQDKQLPEILEDVARLGAQLLMQAALEAEVTEFLGRARYQRASALSFWKRRNRHASWIMPRRTRALPALASPFSRRLAPLSSGEPVSPA